MDSVYSSIENKKIIFGGWFRSFLISVPIAPIYGFGVLILMFLSIYISEYNIFVQILIIGIVLTLFEYISGVLMLKIVKRRAWDYRKKFLNLQGHVDFVHFVYWAVLGYLFIEFLLPILV
jgi:uncharacterized membrane protein